MLAHLETAEEAGDAAYRAGRLGYALLRQGESVLALGPLRRALERRPDYAEALSYLGYALWQQGQPAQALAALERALALDPQQVSGHYFRALALRSQERWEEAEAAFQQSLKLDPGNAAAYLDLADLYARQARYPQAEKYFAQAIEVAPHKAPLRLAQANFYLGRLYRVERGLRAAQEVVRLDPASAEAWDTMGWGLYLNLRPEEAMAALARALELAPDLAAAHYHLGVIHERQGNRLAAARAYQQAAALDLSGTYAVRAQQALEGLR